MIQPNIKLPININDKNSLEIVAFIAILSFLGVVWSNLKPTYDLFDSFSRRKLSILKESLNDGKVTKPIKEVLQDQVDLILFTRATGIKDYKNLRGKIIELYQFANGRLTYLDFKRAYSFLEHGIDGLLEVRRIKRTDHIAHIISWGIAFSCLLICGLFLFLIIFLPIQESLRLKLWVFIVYFYGLSLVILTQTQILPTAKKIKSEIQRRRKNLHWEN